MSGKAGETEGTFLNLNDFLYTLQVLEGISASQSLLCTTRRHDSAKESEDSWKKDFLADLTVYNRLNSIGRGPANKLGCAEEAY
jgi:hypothetical protein